MQFPSLETTGLICIGIVSICVLKEISSFLYTYVIGPAFNKVDFKSKGKWALVTGSTDGIGKEYAKQVEVADSYQTDAAGSKLINKVGQPHLIQFRYINRDFSYVRRLAKSLIKLASRGCNIILVSRTMEKLKAVASEIEKEYMVETKVIQVDFTEGEKIYEHIAKEVSGLEIGTLVNNVGMYYRYPDKLCDIPDLEPFYRNMLNTNVTSVVRMTALLLPEMLKRKKGVVINVCSVAAILPGPMVTLYAATKAFVDKFTEGLQDEYRNSGVIIQNLLPGVVASNMTALKEGSLRKPDAKTYVESAIKTVGSASRTVGYTPHAIEMTTVKFMYFLSRNVVVWIVEKYMKDQKKYFLKVKK